MRTLLAILTLTFSVGAIAFDNGPYEVFKYSTDVTCAELTSMIEHKGNLVVYESANPPIYELRVYSSFYCPSGEQQIKYDVIPTMDGYCMVKGCETHPGSGR